MANQMMDSFQTIPFPAFFKVWYHIQKEIPEDDKKKLLTRVGRAIGKEVNVEGVEDVSGFLTALKKFLEEEWAITEKADLEVVEENNDVVKVKCHMDACKMCFPNSHYKVADGGTPVCMFPHVVMGALGKVRSKFNFKNLAFDCVEKPGPVGECIMTWNVK